MYAIKCDSLTITYDNCGVATIRMTVYSNESELDLTQLPDTFGEVKFNITSRDIVNVQVKAGIFIYSIVMKGTS